MEILVLEMGGGSLRLGVILNRRKSKFEFRVLTIWR